VDDVKRVEPARSRGGKWVRIGDEEYKVPALALLAIQELQAEVPKLASIRGIPSAEQMGVVFKIIHAALARNYPDLKVKDVEEMIDLSNFQDVLNSVLEVSGFKRVPPGEGVAPGELPASTGTTSTSP